VSKINVWNLFESAGIHLRVEVKKRVSFVFGVLATLKKIASFGQEKNSKNDKSTFTCHSI